MELTIEQALEQGIAAHKDGKLQDAEGLYRAILQFQPLHPDANHNLGVIAVSVDQATAALPLFKIALEANPKIEQFWLSYIDALVKVNQVKNAKQTIKEAKKKGFDAKNLEALLLQSKVTVNIKEPSQEQLSILSEYYQNGRWSEAEKLALSIIQEFSKHQFAWKVLGSVLKRTGKASESLVASQKSVQLMPQDADAHYNLGNTLKELGRLDEAEASYTQAIALKPDYAEAHYNLGITLQQLVRLDEAEASYRQAIALKPDYAEAHNNLGATFKERGQWEEAEASYTQAIALKPDFAEAHSNLGIMLYELGRLDEAAASYTHAIALKPDNLSAKHMLAALTGKTTATAPREYVKGLFDNYATKFEGSLIDNLEYKIPKLITQMILEHHKDRSLGSVLDLGCGTGLAGVEIKPYCEYLEGIDLSNNMLEEASQKNIYDKLVHLGIEEYLALENLDFEYFISTDVFIYLGDLSEVFRLIKSRNKTGGKLVFSVEDYNGDSFFLEQSGRYSHSKQYITSLCEKFGYTLSHLQNQNIRKERNQYIKGYLYLLDF